MKARSLDPLRLDVEAAAANGARLQGRWPLVELPRLEAAGEATVDWSARFERRTVPAGRAQPWLHLQASAQVVRECQRCLQPVTLPLAVDRRLRFAATEEEAAALDADSDEDVLATSRSLDLRALVEDELLLALPLVPRHEDCSQPVPEAVAQPQGRAPHPFAALARLKSGDRH